MRRGGDLVAHRPQGSGGGRHPACAGPCVLQGGGSPWRSKPRPPPWLPRCYGRSKGARQPQPWPRQQRWWSRA